MKITKLDIVEIFTMSCGFSGTIAVIVGASAYVSGLLGVGTIHLGKVLDDQRSTLRHMMLYGGISTGAGLFATGLAVGVARTVGERLADEPVFTDDEIAYFKKIKPCKECKYFHGVNYNSVDLICAIHPHGVDTDTCPDWESR
ncbi:hypothetical protein [Calothrix sp. CCY 0018]|uniref:hypothetical protein n=1 Tax=Calothrix sp. CCY 0018 TaxID=3103864 RepID=UPI0039C6ECF2